MGLQILVKISAISLTTTGDTETSKPSFIIVRQKGHETAIVSAPVSKACNVKKSAYVDESLVSSSFPEIVLRQSAR